MIISYLCQIQYVSVFSSVQLITAMANAVKPASTKPQRNLLTIILIKFLSHPLTPWNLHNLLVFRRLGSAMDKHRYSSSTEGNSEVIIILKKYFKLTFYPSKVAPNIIYSDLDIWHNKFYYA